MLMLNLLRGLRSFVSVLLVGLAFALHSLPLRLLVLPGAWLFPSQRFRLVSLFMKSISWAIVTVLSLGGARFRRDGRIPTADPVLVVANHQSLLDVVQIVLLSRPRVPAYVTRARYSRFIPLVSACVRLLGSPIVDPRRDPRGSVEAIRQGVRTLPHGLMIFPEGHRSTDGELRPFRTAGLETILEERRWPVYLVVNDGLWRVRRFVDLLFRVHLIDATSRVVGPFLPPEDESAIPDFVAQLRTRLGQELADGRAPRTKRQEAAPLNAAAV